MLIFDKRRPARAGNTNIRPPKGGRIKTAPPASGPRLGRSSAWGVPPPGPLGCAPCGLTATGTRCLPTSREGQAQRAGPQARRVSGLRGKFQKAPQGREAGRGLGGRAPPGSGGVVNRVEPVGGQWSTRSVVHAVHGRPRLSTPERATGRVLRTEREGKRRKPAPVLDPRDNFGTTKDNFGRSKDKKSLFFVFQPATM